MSSVQRFLKQHAPSQQFFSAPTTVLDATAVYEFVPTSTNVVGNYPPGYVQLIYGNAAAVVTALAAQNNSVNAPNGVVLRDMGKTIFAPVGSATGAMGHFRQVQLLAPKPISASQGFIGGVAGNTFGVLGVPAGGATTDAYTSYLTFYIAVPLGGVVAGPASGAVQLPGGEM